MIFLNDRDIRDCIEFKDLMDGVEEAYRIYGEGRYYMPDRISIDREGDMLMFMPGYTEASMGTKILTLFPENTNRGLPVIDGLMLVNDLETGEVLSIMDGKTITELRTGAVGGVGIRHTCPEDVRTVGLIGTGVQGLVQLQYACDVRDIELINIYNRNEAKTKDFIARLKKTIDPNIEIRSFDQVEELVRSSELIITTTTSNSPVLPDDEDLLRGRHFIGIGSYKQDMREFPDAMSRVADQVFIDTDFAKEETGDLFQPLEKGILDQEKIISFSDFLLDGEELGETTWYKSVGMALFDVVVARVIYDKAREKAIGQQVEF